MGRISVAPGLVPALKPVLKPVLSMERHTVMRLLKLAGVALAFFVVVNTISNGISARHAAASYNFDAHPSLRPSREVIACKGLFGKSVEDGSDNLPREYKLSGVLPQPWTGNYRDILLPQTWMSAEDRYGPYGWTDAVHGHFIGTSMLATLQADCFEVNARRFPRALTGSPFDKRFRLPAAGDLDAPETAPRLKDTTGRQAIVLRSYDSFQYTKDDLLFIRSLVSETSLEFGGAYDVFLLVDVKSEHRLWTQAGDYEEVLHQIMPRELRDMTILFNEELQRAWYPKVHEYRAVLQIQQPLQLFAKCMLTFGHADLVFDQYDHYWQFEMDTRFSGNAGHLLRACELFAKMEPRKQAHQRTTIFPVPRVYASYNSLVRAVNYSLDGSDPYFTGIRVPEVPNPIGLLLNPPPPSAEADDFSWGVGEDADYILFNYAMNVTLDQGWMFKHFIFNFTQGIETPRVQSAPAMGRSSYNLLIAAHDAQRLRGEAVHSESTLPSYALWHGMKISKPPMPQYSRLDATLRATAVDMWANGGAPDPAYGGMAHGESVYGKQFVAEEEKDQQYTVLDPTFRFASDYSQQLWGAWMANDRSRRRLRDLPTLAVKRGRVVMPNMIMHPIKTQPKRPESLAWIFEPGAIPGPDS